MVQAAVTLARTRHQLQAELLMAAARPTVATVATVTVLPQTMVLPVVLWRATSRALNLALKAVSQAPGRAANQELAAQPLAVPAAPPAIEQAARRVEY